MGASKDPFAEDELQRLQSKNEKDDDSFEDSDEEEDPALLVDKVYEDAEDFEHQISEKNRKQNRNPSHKEMPI